MWRNPVLGFLSIIECQYQFQQMHRQEHDYVSVCRGVHFLPMLILRHRFIKLTPVNVENLRFDPTLIIIKGPPFLAPIRLQGRFGHE